MFVSFTERESRRSLQSTSSLFGPEIVAKVFSNMTQKLSIHCSEKAGPVDEVGALRELFWEIGASWSWRVQFGDGGVFWPFSGHVGGLAGRDFRREGKGKGGEQGRGKRRLSLGGRCVSDVSVPLRAEGRSVLECVQLGIPLGPLW